MAKESSLARDAASLLLALAALFSAFGARACRPVEPAVERRDLREYHIDLNSADAALLTLVTGIGPRLAAALVEWRERNGPFRSAGDLMEVRGIGPRRAREILRWSWLEGFNAQPEDARGRPRFETEPPGEADARSRRRHSSEEL